jgi:hypothetical protein
MNRPASPQPAKPIDHRNRDMQPRRSAPIPTQSHPEPASAASAVDDSAGKFRFRLSAGDGEIIAVGEAYESRQARSTE